MVRNVIFDIGRVLIGFEWMDYVHSVLDSEEDIRIVNEAMWKSGIWNERDRGVISEEEALNQMIAQAPDHEAQIREVEERSGEGILRKDYAIPWIEELKTRGFHVFFLSNYSRRVMKLGWNALDFLPYMDGGIFSCEVKMLKPEPGIYSKLLHDYALNAEECVFIDDNPNNIEAASKMGFRTVLFEEREQAVRDLERILSEGK